MHAVASESGQLARDLYRLLEDLDPARPTLGDATDRLDALQEQLLDLLDHTWPDESLRAVQDRLSELNRLVADQAPDNPLANADWAAFRAQVQPAYEELARTLRDYEIHVPSLRPTNYARNVYHVLNAVLIVGLVETVLTPTWMWAIALTVVTLAWSMELSRRLDGRINALLLRAFKPVAHPHEAHRVNSATWFATALVLLLLCFEPLAGALGVAVLGFGDPAAAAIGRRFGRIRLIGGRSLEGSTAFVIAGGAAAFTVLKLWHPEIPALPVAFACATFGAGAELLTRRIDDNLAIPLAAAFGAWLALP